MSVLAELAEANLPLSFTVLFVAQMLARELGQAIGRRHAARERARPEGVNVVVGGMLALLAFVLALTLSFANGRFQERRDGMLKEANAIGSAWGRAQALGEARGLEIARLLESYLAVRREFVEAPPDRAKVDAINRRSQALQGEIWTKLSAIVRERPDPLAVAVLTGVEEAFGAASATRFAFDTHLPPQLFWLLIGMSVASMAALGYEIGLRGQTLRVLCALLIAMWTMVIIDVLDLNSARIGSRGNDASIYGWVQEGFGGDVAPP